MSNNATIKARQKQKYDSYSNWQKAGENGFIPLKGEFIIYSKEDKDENGVVFQRYPQERIKLGDGLTCVHNLSFIDQNADGVQDVTALPTTDINPNCIYRLLTANMVMDRTIQSNATCHIVTELGASGESFIIYRGPNDYLTTGYYNKTEDKLYCYIDQTTKNALTTIIDESSLSDLEKIAAKGAILLLGSGWKNTEDILKTISTIRDDIAYGGVITSLDEAIGNNVLYVYLTSELYQYVSGKWVLSNDMKSRVVALENRCTSFHVQGTTPNLPAFNLSTTTGEITFLNPCFYVYNNKFGSISKGTVVSGATTGNALALVKNNEGILVFKSFTDVQGTDIVIFNALRWANGGYYNPDCISISSAYQVDGELVGIDAIQDKEIQLLQNRCASFHVQGTSENCIAFKLDTDAETIEFLNPCFYIYNNTYGTIKAGTKVASALSSNAQALVYSNATSRLAFRSISDITESDIVIFYTMRWGTNINGNSNQGYYNPDCISIQSAYQVDDKIIGFVPSKETIDAIENINAAQEEAIKALQDTTATIKIENVEQEEAIQSLQNTITTLESENEAQEKAIQILQNRCASFHMQSTSPNAAAFRLDTETGEITFLNQCYYVYNNSYKTIAIGTSVSGATSNNILAFVDSSDTLSFKKFSEITETDIVIFYVIRWGNGKAYKNPDTISISSPYYVDNTLCQAYQPAERIVYVSTTGSDTNDGNSVSAPLKSIQKAIDSGAVHIAILPGTYYESISVENKKKLHIYTYLTENDADSNYNFPKAVIDGRTSVEDETIARNTCGVFRGVQNLVLENIIFQYANKQVCQMSCCNNFTINNCEFHRCASIGNGLQVLTSSGTLTNVVASYNGNDGLSFAGKGSATIINAYCHHNGLSGTGDGVSHHNGYTGSVIGGEFCFNDKGGISSPTFGAKINIYDVYTHDNNYGIYTHCPESSNAYKIEDTICAFNCVIKNNKVAGVLAEGYNVYAYSCLFEENAKEYQLLNNGTFTPQNCTHQTVRLEVTKVESKAKRLTFNTTTLKTKITSGQVCTIRTNTGLLELTVDVVGDNRATFKEPVTGIAVGDMLISLSEYVETATAYAKDVYAGGIVAETAHFAGDVTIGDKGRLITEAEALELLGADGSSAKLYRHDITIKSWDNINGNGEELYFTLYNTDPTDYTAKSTYNDNAEIVRPADTSTFKNAIAHLETIPVSGYLDSSGNWGNGMYNTTATYLKKGNDDDTFVIGYAGYRLEYWAPIEHGFDWEALTVVLDYGEVAAHIENVYDTVTEIGAINSGSSSVDDTRVAALEQQVADLTAQLSGLKELLQRLNEGIDS